MGIERRLKAHGKLLLQGVAMWAFFWVAGLPQYYQQYSNVAMGIGTTLLAAAMAIVGVWMLGRVQPARRVMLAVWVSFYYSVPFLLLDAFYCGLYLGHGWAFIGHYWYLSIFYPLPWLMFVPMAYLMPDSRGTLHRDESKTAN